jgi:hydrogenase maturation protease
MRKISGQNLVGDFSMATRSDLQNPFLIKGSYSDGGTRRKSAFLEREGAVISDKHRAGVRCNTLVLGMGSEFLGDDGLGVHALRELSKANLPAGTELIEVANHLMDALVALQRADRIIVLDVLRAKGKPGSIYRVSLQSGEISEGIPPSHSLDLFKALYLGGCYGFIDVILIGVEPSVIDWSANLSKEVRKALPFMVQTVKDELNRPSLRDSMEDPIPFAGNAGPDPLSEDSRRYL